MTLKRSCFFGRRELRSAPNPRSRVVEGDLRVPVPRRRSSRNCVVKNSVERPCSDMPSEEATDETKTSSEYNPGKYT